MTSVANHHISYTKPSYRLTYHHEKIDVAEQDFRHPQIPELTPSAEHNLKGS